MRGVRAWWLAATVILIAGSMAIVLPPRARQLPGRDLPEPVRGVIHVHTKRSDGSGTIDEVAAAAARAGLHFVVLSDHSDATRAPQPPAYRHGVLCIDAAEIPTSNGHVLALGLARAAPYPLGGEPRDVIEDVARLGGMSVAAHPTSDKPALRWQDWSAAFDGLEWLNADSEWRDERPLTLAGALLMYPFRHAETLASLLDRPSEVLARWDDLLRRRPVVALAGADAHASLVNGEDNPYSDRSPIALPAYEQSFKTFSVALPDVTLTGDPLADAPAVIAQIRGGDFYTSIDALARPARMSFVARSGAHEAHSGGTLPPEGPVTIDLRTNAPATARIVLVHDGRRVEQGKGSVLSYRSSETRGSYRAEVYLDGKDVDTAVPWIVSNPIYVGKPAASTSPAFVPSQESVLYRGGVLGDLRVTSAEAPESASAAAWPVGWGIEASAKSRGVAAEAQVNGEAGVLLRYALGGTKQDSPWVMLGMPAGHNLASFDHVAFIGQADRPMRLWVQFWRPISTGNEYWRRSVYLDSIPRELVVPFAEMRSPTPGAPRVVPLTAIVSLQFVVDGVHTPLARSGQFWIGNVRYQR